MAGGIPGGPVVKISPSNAGLILGQGTKISCVTAKKIKT